MTLHKAWVFGSLLLLSTVLLPLPASAGSTLDVADVLRLHEAGLSEDIIISEIIVTETTFALSVDEILRLQELGLSDRLIKFMIDTGLSGSAAEADVDYESTLEFDPGPRLDDSEADVYGSYDSYEYATGDEVWVNVIEEEERPEVTYHVSLSWGYPHWWYDTYWDDYWYYDAPWEPYRVSWVYGYGGWYPYWYTSRVAWASPYWGYRRHCHGTWGAGYYPDHHYGGWDDYHYGYWDGYEDGYHDGWAHADWSLSTSKKKVRNGSSGKSRTALAKVGGLKMPVGGDRLPTKVIRPTRLADRRTKKTHDDRVRLADDRPIITGGTDHRRPVRIGAKNGSSLVDGRGNGIGKPVKSDGRLEGRDRVRAVKPTVRKPADATRTPTKRIGTPSRLGGTRAPTRDVDPPTKKRVRNSPPTPRDKPNVKTRRPDSRTRVTPRPSTPEPRSKPKVTPRRSTPKPTPAPRPEPKRSSVREKKSSASPPPAVRRAPPKSSPAPRAKAAPSRPAPSKSSQPAKPSKSRGSAKKQRSRGR